MSPSAMSIESENIYNEIERNEIETDIYNDIGRDIDDVIGDSEPNVTPLGAMTQEIGEDTDRKNQVRQTTLNRRKVLVVEDDGDMAQLTRFLIEQFSGAKCDIVVDSYEAIEALCDNSYDYLVVDQNLPGLKGIEVLMKLDTYLDTDPLLAEQCRFTHKIPVLLMSAENINVPHGLKLSHFEITDRINKRDLNIGLARNFAS